MICPICKKEMSHIISIHHCKFCHVWFFEKYSLLKDSDLQYEFQNQLYEKNTFERMCKLKSFW